MGNKIDLQCVDVSLPFGVRTYYMHPKEVERLIKWWSGDGESGEAFTTYFFEREKKPYVVGKPDCLLLNINNISAILVRSQMLFAYENVDGSAVHEEQKTSSGS